LFSFNPLRTHLCFQINSVRCPLIPNSWRSLQLTFAFSDSSTNFHHI
jgi:hypothetical protein